MNIANQCKNFGVKQITISGLTFTTRLNANVFHHPNNSITQKHGYSFTDTRQFT